MHGSRWRREETRASRASTCRAARAPLADPTNRHTFGTRCAAAGVPLRTLQAWMGHADIKTTMKYLHYAPHADDARLVAAAFAVEDPAGRAGGQGGRRGRVGNAPGSLGK